VAHVVYENGGLTLSNSGSVSVELTNPLDQVVDQVAWLQSLFPAAEEGRSLSVVNPASASGNNDPGNWQVSQCAYGSRSYGNPPTVFPSYGTPGWPHDVCLADGGLMLSCLPADDAGVAGDAGAGGDAGASVDAAHLLLPRDAGLSDNQPPLITVTAPAQPLSSGTVVTVDWEATDADGDSLLVTVLRAAQGAGSSGVYLFTQQGSQGPVHWDTTGTPSGVWRILVQVEDGHGHLVVGEAAGTVTVGGAAASVITVERPVGGEVASGSLTITLRTTAQDGLISVFYDPDAEGLDGIAIAGGIRARAGILDVVWNTAAVTAGEYYIYAVLEAPQGSHHGYSAGSVSVRQSDGGCACEQTWPRLPGDLAVWLLVGVWGVGRCIRCRQRMKE
jgi:hypothetical protein